MIGSGGIPEELTESWTAFIDDLEETADEYRDRGYDVAAIHAGDVVPLPDRVAFDVLAPGSEFDALQSLVDEFTPDEFTVFKATEGETAFVLVVTEDNELKKAVCIPLFFHHSITRSLVENAREAGLLQIQVRPLSDDEHVVFTIEDPDIVFE